MLRLSGGTHAERPRDPGFLSLRSIRLGRPTSRGIVGGDRGLGEYVQSLVAKLEPKGPLRCKRPVALYRHFDKDAWATRSLIRAINATFLQSQDP